jgi:hypothetical protein
MARQGANNQTLVAGSATRFPPAAPRPCGCTVSAPPPITSIGRAMLSAERANRPAETNQTADIDGLRGSDSPSSAVKACIFLTRTASLPRTHFSLSLCAHSYQLPEHARCWSSIHPISDDRPLADAMRSRWSTRALSIACRPGPPVSPSLEEAEQGSLSPSAPLVVLPLDLIVRVHGAVRELRVPVVARGRRRSARRGPPARLLIARNSLRMTQLAVSNPRTLPSLRPS